MKHLISMIPYRALLATCVAAVAIGACDSDDSSTPHPTDRLDFPIDVTADPSGKIVWVVSGNFDLRFRNAAVLAIDTRTNQFVPELAFEVGGFPGAVTLLERGGRAVAAYITSRAEDRLFFATLGGDDPSRPTITCPGGDISGGILRCPKDKALDQTTVETADGPVDLTLGQDPFGLVLSPRRTASEPDLLLSAAMVDGQLATFALADDGTPTIVGSSNFLDGLYALARAPTTGRIYATSKLANLISSFTIGPRYDSERPSEQVLDPINPWVTLSGSASIPEPRATDRARDLAISGDGTRLYLAYRAPDSLVIVDIADAVDGTQRQRVINKIPMDDDPSDIVVVPNPSGVGELVYVSCFKADRIEVVDPVAGLVVGGIHTGDGPSGMAYVADGNLRRLYVALFHDDAVGVVELDPTSPYYHTEVGEIR